MALWRGATPRAAAQLGFCFSAGTFAAGTYWLYTSIHIFGEAPIWVAVGLMLALVAIMALYQALVGWCVARFLPRTGMLRTLIGMPAPLAARRVVARLVSERLCVAVARVLA